MIITKYVFNFFYIYLKTQKHVLASLLVFKHLSHLIKVGVLMVNHVVRLKSGHLYFILKRINKRLLNK